MDAPLAKVSRWFHGDLHPLNVLVRHQRIAGVIDWGDVGGGDVATDLAAFWMLFHGRPRRRALATYGSVDEATIARARGWAVSFGTMLLDAGLVDDHRQAVAGGKEAFERRRREYGFCGAIRWTEPISKS